MKKNEWQVLPKHPELFVGQYVVPNFMSNSVAVQVAADEWVVVSPGAQLLENWQAQFGGSNIRISLVMPNGYHFLGIEHWLRAFPYAHLYASEKAIVRLNQKGLSNITALEQSSPNLPEGYSWRFPPGHRGGDVWLYKKPVEQSPSEKDCTEKDCIWVTCDSFLNYERMSNQPVARAMQKLLGAAPGLKMSQVVKWLIVDDRTAFKLWVLQELAQSPPTVLVPAHGEADQAEGLALRLTELVNNRL